MIEKFIEKLKEDILFKEDTKVGDSVLVFIEKTSLTKNTIKQGIVTNIENDIKRDWYIVTMIFLFPPTRVRWKLKYEYFTGQTTFTMMGTSMWMASVKDLNTPTPIPKPETDEKSRKPFKLLKGGKCGEESKTKDG